MDSQTNPFAALSFIVAPAVLTNACTVLILSTSNRLARAVDRARELTTGLESPGALASPTAQGDLQELAATEQRMLMLIRALRAFYMALGGFATAALVSLIGAVIAPAGFDILTIGLEIIVVAAGAAAVGALVRGALLLVRETRIVMDVMERLASRLRSEFEQRQATTAHEQSEDAGTSV